MTKSPQALGLVTNCGQETMHLECCGVNPCAPSAANPSEEFDVDSRRSLKVEPLTSLGAHRERVMDQPGEPQDEPVVELRSDPGLTVHLDEQRDGLPVDAQRQVFSGSRRLL